MKRISLLKQILIAVCVGIFLGVLLGEKTSILLPIGKAFIMFIQMVILPYIACSIIHGIGTLRRDATKQIFKKAWFFLVTMWLVVLVPIYTMGILYGRSTFMIDASGETTKLRENFLAYIVPENPIYDFANNIVPAIAIFAIIVGFAVMHMPHKEPLVSFLERINNIIEKILDGITRIAPIGIAALIAYAAGTINMEILSRLGIYIFPTIILILLLTFWIFPILISSFTPLSYREVLKEFKEVCILPFAIGSPTIAIPFLYRSVERYANKFHVKDKEFHNASQTIVPLAYTFMQLGNFMSLLFIMFLSFFFRLPIDWVNKGIITFMAIPLSFGSPELSVNAISFLTSKLGIPESGLKVYDYTSIFIDNFQVLLSAVSMTSFAILLLLGFYHKLSRHLGKFIRHFAAFFVILFFAAFFLKDYYVKQNSYQINPKAMSIQESYPNDVEVTVYKTKEEAEEKAPPISSDGTLVRILDQRIIRVGYHASVSPYCYINDDGDLAGYNIAFAYKLAHDLNCRIEFIPYEYDTLANSLNQNKIDIAFSPLAITATSLSEMEFSHYYEAVPFVLVVAKKNESQYLDLKTLKKNSKVRVGGFGYTLPVIKAIFPKATSSLVKNPESLLAGEIDVLLWNRVEALAYCRDHTDLIMINFGKQIGYVYLAYPVKDKSLRFINFMDQWLYLQKNIGFDEKQYNYWINGETIESSAERWSIVGNIFHWTD